MSATSLYRAGFTALVSVIPPGATLTENSKIDPAELGKTPGNRVVGGKWCGYNWRGTEVTEHLAARWEQDGANIGFQAREFPAVDIDCTDALLSKTIRDHVELALGEAPVRIGRAPKALLIYRTSIPFGRMRLWIKDESHDEGEMGHLVEILGDGQQYVVEGIHPVTGQPYTWERPLATPAELCEITNEHASQWLDDLQADLEFLGYTCRREGTGRTAVERELIGQDQHRAPSLEALRDVVAAIPNNLDFAGRDDYLRMGYAIKAAGGDEALPVFLEWCDRWEDGANDPDTVEADWGRMIPPYEVGWSYLLDTAQRRGYAAAQDEFTADLTQPYMQASAKPPAASNGLGAFQSAQAYSDTSAATRLMNKWGSNYRYCDALGGWLHWEGNKWAPDERRQAETVTMFLLNEMAGEASADTSLHPRDASKVVSRLTGSGSVDAALKSFRRMIGVTKSQDEFDADPYLLNTPAGAIDLKTGALVGGRHAVTKSTAVAPAEGACPTWQRFLLDCCGGDVELVAYLKRSFGYWLTGSTQEQQFLFIWGPGGNGKSVFQQAVMSILGDYGVVAGSEVFAASQQERHKQEIARLRGARFVGSSETQEGRYLDEAKVKLLTGGDKIEARFLHQNSFEFTPQFKIVMLGNHKPMLRNPDRAIARRLHLMNWTFVPEQPDPELAVKLKAEYPQILAWAIEGCVEWQQKGLQPPESILAATKAYLDDEDPLRAFLEERCVEKANAFTASHDIFESWQEWAHERNEHVGTQKRLVSALVERFGCERARDTITGQRGLRGIELIFKPGEFTADARPAAKLAA